MSGTTQSQRCGKCGAALSGYAPDGLCAACLLESAFDEQDIQAGEPIKPVQFFAFKDYELLEEIARGGMGVVYRARQISLNRIVAIKMILGGHLANAAEMKRFRAEAETAAQLQHPNIVAIHEVGEHAGQPFFSMDLIEGQNLAQLVHNEPLPSRRAAAYLKTIAEAVQYAHLHSVLHRDLKPSNILIDENDQPCVTDFGLAKRLTTDAQLSTNDPQLTQTGQVLGSPSFIPPEQAAGRKDTIGPASDVYSLGAILYHVITGRPPFVAETLTQTLRMVAEQEPVSPRLLNASVPRDLETICLKCLEKDPKRRYSTARELADELGRFLRNEPIRARPVGVALKVHRWCLRNKALAVAGTAIVILVLMVAVVSTVAAARLKHANREGQEKLRAAYLSEARALRWSGREGRRYDALGAIRKATAIRPGLDLRNEAIAAMALVDLRPEREWTVTAVSATGMTFDPSCEQYAYAETNGTIVVRRTRDDAELMRLPATRFPPFEYYFNAEGRLLAVHYRGKGDFNFDFKVYDLKNSGKVILDTPGRWVRTWRFSRDGCQLAVAWKEKNSDNPHSRLSFFDVSSGRELNSITLPALPYGMAFAPDASQVALSSTESLSVQVHSVPDGRVLQTLMHSNGVHHLEWSSNGRRLASACFDGNIYLWDMTMSSPLPRLLPHGSVAVTCVFTPREDLLVSFGWNSLAKLWEVQTGRERLRLSCDAFLGFSLDGRRAIVRRRKGTAGISEFASGEECRSFTFGSETVGAKVCFSPDGRWMASAHRDGLRLWDLATGREIHHKMEEIVGLEFTRDGSALISQAAQQIMSWPIRSSMEKETTRIEVGPPFFWRPERMEASHPANRMLRVVRGKGCLFDTSSLAVERYLTTPSGVFGGTLSGDGRHCATWSWDTGVVDVWDAGDGRHLATPTVDPSPCASFSPDRRWLITGSSHEYTLWELGTWIQRRTIPRGDTGGASGKVAFSTDGNVMALSLARGEVGLFDATTFELLARFEPQEVNTIQSLDFSPDGSKLAIGTTENTIHVWDLRLVRQQLAELGLDIPRPPLLAAPPFPGRLELSIIGPNVGVP